MKFASPVDAVRENFSLPALPCAQGSAGSEEFSRTASHSIIFLRTAAASNIFSRCANKCKKRSLNATKCEKSLVLSLSTASRKSSQPRAKEEKVNLAFVNDEGRPSTLRHSNLSFRSNISSVFEFQKRVELQLIFLEVLNRAVIFENISTLSFGPRQNMFR